MFEELRGKSEIDFAIAVLAHVTNSTSTFILSQLKNSLALSFLS